MQLVPPSLHDQQLLQVAMNAPRQADAQQWEVLLA